MSSSEQPLPPIQQIPVEVQSVVKDVFQRFKDFRNIQIRTFIEEIITFISIIGAYYCVSLSFRKEKDIQNMIGIQFSKLDTQAVLLLVFALYLLALKVLYAIAYKYDTTPPKKVLPTGWQQMQQCPTNTPQQVESLQQKPLPADSFSLMIEQLLNYSMYGLLFMLCTTSYTFISLFNKSTCLLQLKIEYSFVSIEHINYLVLWFVSACVFYSLGKLIGKLTKIKTFHHFGLAIGVIVIVIEIGLSNGFNMFLFV